MWTTDQLGLAVCRDHASAWYLDARGGEHGVGVIATTQADDDGAFADSRRFVSLSPVDQDVLPAAGEQYVRGDELHVNYPQAAGSSYAVRLAFKPIETAKNLIVLEVRISIQTDLLDTHPKIDVDTFCRSIDSRVPTDPQFPTDSSGDDEVEGVGSAPISVAVSKEHSVSVLLGPHDSPFTTNHSTDSLLRLRLFGDFLEKGVIRTARPWIVIDRSADAPGEEQLEKWWRQLCGSPLPLTP
jgi:hypothetical protein